MEDLDKTLKRIAENFTMTDEGNIVVCLGIQIEHDPGFMRISHPNLVKRIIDVIPEMNKANPKSIPMDPTSIMTKDMNGKER